MALNYFHSINKKLPLGSLMPIGDTPVRVYYSISKMLMSIIQNPAITGGNRSKYGKPMDYSTTYMDIIHKIRQIVKVIHR